jgi:hypothetical protein
MTNYFSQVWDRYKFVNRFSSVFIFIERLCFTMVKQSFICSLETKLPSRDIEYKKYYVVYEFFFWYFNTDTYKTHQWVGDIYIKGLSRGSLFSYLKLFQSFTVSNWTLLYIFVKSLLNIRNVYHVTYFYVRNWEFHVKRTLYVNYRINDS